MDEHPSTDLGEKKLLRIAIICIALLIVIIVLVSWKIWNKPDYVIAYVPVPILEWAFIGGMVGVLYRLAYRRNNPNIRLYIWVIAKPIIGLFMGGVVYFIAAGGALLLGNRIINENNGQPTDLKQILWLNALAFVAGFSDRFSIGVINKIIAGFQTEKGNKDKGDQALNSNRK